MYEINIWQYVYTLNKYGLKYKVEHKKSKIRLMRNIYNKN